MNDVLDERSQLVDVRSNTVRGKWWWLLRTRQWLLLTRWEYLCNWGGSGAFALPSRRRLQLWLCVYNIKASDLELLEFRGHRPRWTEERTGVLRELGVPKDGHSPRAPILRGRRANDRPPPAAKLLLSPA
jgi:hypothetical protein